MSLFLPPKTELRDYQRQALDSLYDWFRAGNKGNPCLVLPTGAGKSHIIAALCREAVQEWRARLLMLTHVKELIAQNADKLRSHWPNAPLGIYSAGLRRRELGEAITFAGIQSVRNRADALGRVDLIVIDECHLVSHNDTGGYRQLINDLQEINPALRVIGLTATPYRLGHGMITDDPAIFDVILEPVNTADLVLQGYLAPLRSKVTRARFDLSNVHRRGGEYIESELAAAVDTDDQNQAVVREVISLAENRRAWLFFCAGVQHARHVRDVLQAQGITAETVTGDTPPGERARILAEYKAGKIRALTNANVLTTGFDYPDIDLIAMLRPTESPGLYVQMAGRGLRLKSHTDHCLVLDFAGVVEKHGPVTGVTPPRTPGQGGDVPMKVCENCNELVFIAVMTCPACGTEFPKPEKEPLRLRNQDIMGLEPETVEIRDWTWNLRRSKQNGKPMAVISYYPAEYGKRVISEFLCLTHGGFAQEKATKTLNIIAQKVNISPPPAGGELDDDYIDAVCKAMQDGLPPDSITYKMEGNFPRVLERVWRAPPPPTFPKPEERQWLDPDEIPF